MCLRATESRSVPVQISDDQVLCAAPGSAEAQSLAEQLRDGGNYLEVVPGIDSVVVRFDPIRFDVDELIGQISGLEQQGVKAASAKAQLVEIPVIYDGPDLESLAAATGLSVNEVISLHTGSDYPVEMVGFTPGFAFIGGLDEKLRVPRREEPRARVPAGSIAVADGRTGLYAISSPGGWNLIGRTTERFFRPEAEDPFPLKAGMRVRFLAVEQG